MYIHSPPGHRKRPPNRRGATTFELEASGLRYTATVGFFDNGLLGEIFLSNHKTGSASDTAARDSGIVASLALQHGVPLEALRKSLMRDSHGAPCGPLAVALDMVAMMDGAR